MTTSILAENTPKQTIQFGSYVLTFAVLLINICLVRHETFIHLAAVTTEIVASATVTFIHLALVRIEIVASATVDLGALTGRLAIQVF